MAQLKMYWIKGTPIKEMTLPEGYSFSLNKGDEADMLAWIECCKNGLVGDDATFENYENSIKNRTNCKHTEDVFFLDYEGKHIATITAIYHPEKNCGEVHMVGMIPEFRGKGLGKYLNNKAIEKLNAQGVKYIFLTTDEWRKGAVKSYLSADFKPVEYDEGMTERWQAVITEYGIDSVDMVNEDALYVKSIYREGVNPPAKIKIGVLGAGRGKTMMDYCVAQDNAELVAICDSFEPSLEYAKKNYGTESITFYSDFDEFLKHDMDAVVLANYANEHAPFAIRCMEAGLHVISEVLPVQTMKQAVELIECVERTGKVYAYAENYCYMAAPRKMRQLYKEGVLGEFEYGEGEYMHNCEPGWHVYSRANPEHWRNTMHACYYCTHSIGPLIHIAGMRPVKVTGFEGPFNARMNRMGAKAGNMGMEVITLENGAILKSIHGVGPSKNSIWYSVYGSKGRMESAREDDFEKEHVHTLYINCDKNEGDNDSKSELASTADGLFYKSEAYGHGGSDFYTMYNFIEYIKGDKNADIIDVYEAMDMFLPGMFAYRSVLAGGIPMDIPNLRDKAEREKWRNDTECTDPAVAGDMLIPSYSKGNPEIPQENYDKLAKKLAEEEAKNKE
ncbi:MAG: GNAT family N-acetyltransferase [Clostridia bacterium]|nr:GNAT family N-acetyltransferase [Clostridia bacterium]